MVGVELVIDKESRKPASEAAEILAYRYAGWLAAVYCSLSCVSFFPQRRQVKEHITVTDKKLALF